MEILGAKLAPSCYCNRRCTYASATIFEVKSTKHCKSCARFLAYWTQ